MKKELCKRGHPRTSENLKGSSCRTCIKMLRATNPYPARQWQQTYRKKHWSKLRGEYRAWKLRTKYGLSTDQYLVMQMQQEDKCAICGTSAENKTLAVDHSHTTGAVRGLLCWKCNLGLWYFKENSTALQAAANYLLVKL